MGNILCIYHFSAAPSLKFSKWLINVLPLLASVEDKFDRTNLIIV